MKVGRMQKVDHSSGQLEGSCDLLLNFTSLFGMVARCFSVRPNVISATSDYDK